MMCFSVIGASSIAESSLLSKCGRYVEDSNGGEALRFATDMRLRDASKVLCKMLIYFTTLLVVDYRGLTYVQFSKP